MWKTIADWAAAFFTMARELQEHRTTLRRLEDRIRDIEEALKLLAQEQRHAREMERAEREKLALVVQQNSPNRQLPPAKTPRKKK